MIVLTTRKACRVALEAVVRKIENWRKLEDRVQFVSTFAEAQRLVQHTNSLNPDMPMLVIDLGTVAQEEGFVKSVETIVAARPWLTTVALTCCGNRDDQTKALFRLRAIPHLHHMDDAECADPASWKQIFRNTFVDRVGAEIEADLIAAEVGARAAAGQVPEAIVFGNAEVLELLHLAPRLKKASDLAKLKGVSRVTLWARYKRMHHSPSDLLRMFRCLWSGFPRPILRALPAILSDFPSILSDFPRRLLSFKGFRPAASDDRECVL